MSDVKVIGNGRIKFFEAPDEVPHAPGDDPRWQESFVLMLWDVQSRVYAFLRLSQVPNQDGGKATVWLNIWTPGQMYKNTNVELALKDTDRTASSLSVGNGLCRYAYDGNHRWSINDSDTGVSAELVIRDIHQGLCFYPDADSHFVSETTGSHIEASGRITGTINLKGTRYIVDGRGWRDHSWGKRNWNGIRAHRFFSANFGEALHVSCISYIGEDGALTKNGILIRNSDVEFTRDFSIVARIGEDGVSNCGGTLDVRLREAAYHLDFEPVGKSAISVIDGFPCVNSLCLVRLGEEVGVGVAETSNNAQGGSQRPFVFPSSVGVMENGLFPTA